MHQHCQVSFDDDIRQLTIQLKVNSSLQTMTLSYDDIRRGLVPALASSRASHLTYRELKLAATEIARRFTPDPSSRLSWANQFNSLLGQVAGVLHPVNPLHQATPEQLRALRIDVKTLNDELCVRAGVTPKEFQEALSVGYCSGVDSLFCTDDYLTVRQGGKVVAIVPLPGNDYVSLKEYYENLSRRMLEQSNIEALREGIRQMKLEQALELVQRPGTLRPSQGLALGTEN